MSSSSSDCSLSSNDSPLLIGVELNDEVFEKSRVDVRGEDSTDDRGGEDGMCS